MARVEQASLSSSNHMGMVNNLDQSMRNDPVFSIKTVLNA